MVNRGTAALKEQSWSRSTERPEICLVLVSIGDDDVEHGGSGGDSYPSDSQAMIMTMMVLVMMPAMKLIIMTCLAGVRTPRQSSLRV